MKAKTRKSFTKRFKITKNNKLLRRKTGLNHFRAKKSGESIRASRKLKKVSKSEIRRIKQSLVM